MNCPHCGMPQKIEKWGNNDEFYKAEGLCGSHWNHGLEAEEAKELCLEPLKVTYQSPACIEIADQKARADKAEERVRVLEDACRDSLMHLLDAKRHIAPTTTNSVVDDHIARLIALTGGKGEG